MPNATVFIGSFTGFGSKTASKPCVFRSESIAHGRSNASTVLLLHLTTAESMTKSETKLHDSEIYISHSITKTLRNDARLSLICLSNSTLLTVTVCTSTGVLCIDIGCCPKTCCCSSKTRAALYHEEAVG